MEAHHLQIIIKDSVVIAKQINTVEQETFPFIQDT